MTQENYGFWLMPEERAKEQLQNLINALHKKYDAVIFEPHLSLSAASTKDITDPESILKDLATSARPLTLHMPLPTIGELFTQSVFLRFQESKELNTLYQRSCDAWPITPGVFFPHLSLIYKNLSPEERQEIANNLTLSLKSITFDRLQVVKSSTTVDNNADVQNWTIICEYPLGT